MNLKIKKVFSKMNRRGGLILLLCMALLIAMTPLRASADDGENGVVTRANLVLFAYFSGDAEPDWFNETSSGAFTDDYTKGMTNVQRYMNYYDGGQNRSFTSYMSKISGGKYQVENVFPQYNSDTGKVEALQLSITEEQAKKGNYDSQIVEELGKAIDCSAWADKLDLNGDYIIDNVSVVLKGENATTPAGSVQAPTLRSHKFTLGRDNWAGTNLSTSTFNMLNTTALNGKRAGLIAHEYLHSLNYPDLYCEDGGNDYPVGNWDIMSSDGRFMTYPLAYLRMAFSNWVQIPEVEEAGTDPIKNTDGSTTYSLELQTISDNNLCNAVMLTSPVNPYEIFVIEVREQPADYYAGDSLDGGIPKSGVIVYRVDTTVEDFSNFYGKTGVYVFGTGNNKTREDAALDATNSSYGNSNMNETSNAITFSDGTNTGIVVSDVSDINEGKVTLKVTVPDWSAMDTWADSQGIGSAAFVSLTNLNDKPVAVIQSSSWGNSVEFYEYTNGGWSKAANLPDLKDTKGIGAIKLASINGTVFATYVDGANAEGHIKVLKAGKWNDVYDSARKEIGKVASNDLDIGTAGDKLYISYLSEKSPDSYISEYILNVREIVIKDGEAQLGEVQQADTATGNIGNSKVLEQQGSLVVSYKNLNDNAILLKEYNGSKFTPLTSPGIASSYDMITYNQELYYASASANELSISKYDAQTGGWSNYASGEIDSIAPKLAVAQGNLYVVTGPANTDKEGIYAYEVTDTGLISEGLAVDAGARGSGFSMTASGDTLFVGYQSIKDGKAYIKEKAISNKLLSLSITPPNKVSYLVGEKMELRGLKVTANYQNKTRELEPGEYEVTGFGVEENGTLTAKTAGDYTATVTLKSDRLISNTFSYTISNVPVTASITSVKNNGSESREFVYGDSVDVTVQTSGASGKEMALYYCPADGTPVQLTELVEIKEDGSCQLSYDTKEKKLPTGESLPIEVRFVDGDVTTVGDSENIALAKKTLTASITGTLKKEYDGTTAAAADTALQLDGALNNEVSISGTIEYESPDVKEQKLTVKDFQVTFVAGAADFYEAPQAPTATGTISKAAAPQTEDREMQVSNKTEREYVYELEQVLPSLSQGQSWGEVTYELDSIILAGYYTEGTAEIKEGKLILPVENVDSTEEKEIGNIKITVKSSNFQDFTAQIKVRSINQKIPDVNKMEVQGTLTYGQTLSELGIEAEIVDNTTQAPIEGTITWTDGNLMPNAGDYQAEWTFVPKDNAYATITGKEAINVARRTVSVFLDTEGTVSKTYDGTTELPADSTVVISKVEGILDKDTDNISVDDQSLTASYKTADAGTTEIIVSGLSLTGDDDIVRNYELAVSPLTVETGITQADPQAPKQWTVGELKAGEPLSSITLSGEFTGINDEILTGTISWKNPDTKLEAGKHTVAWVFTPESANYAAIEGDVEITVTKVDEPSEEPDDPGSDNPPESVDNPNKGTGDNNNQTAGNTATSDKESMSKAVNTGDDFDAKDNILPMALSLLIAVGCIYVRRRYYR